MGLGDLRHDVCSPYDSLMSHSYKCNGTETCRCDGISYGHHFNNNINGSQRQCNSGSLSPSSVVDSNSDDSDNSGIGNPCEHCQYLSNYHFSPDMDHDPHNLIQLDNHELHNEINFSEMFYHQDNNSDINISTMKNFCISCKNHSCHSRVATDQTVTILSNDNIQITTNQDDVSDSECIEIETDEDEDIQYEYYDSDSGDDSLSSDDQDLSTDNDDDDDDDDEDDDADNDSDSIQSEESEDDEYDTLYSGYARLWSCSTERATNSDEDLPSWSEVSDDDDDIDGQSQETIINQQEQQEIWESFANSSFPNCLASCSKILNQELISGAKNVKDDNKSGTYSNINNAPSPSRNVIGLDSKCKLQYQEKMKLRENDNPNNDDEDDSSYSRPTRVHFKPGNQLVKVHLMVTWSYAYRAARKGTWSQYRCDQIRFLNKIKNLEEVLQYVLQPQHREKMYNYIAQSSDTSH